MYLLGGNYENEFVYFSFRSTERIVMGDQFIIL